jgi:rare lipoprotein A
MTYQTLTGLTALVATLALSTPASATPSVNSNQPHASILILKGSANESQQLIAQSVGQASFYGNEPGEGGPLTANGERYNPGGLTAAHRTLPFGTRVRVTSPNTGRSVVVRINDRGPFTGGRVIDLSVGAARVLGLTSSGVGTVRMDVLGGGEGGGRRHGRRH